MPRISELVYPLGMATGYRVGGWLLFAVVVLAPLPFGSVKPSVLVVWTLILGVDLILIPVTTLRRPHFLLLGCAAIVLIAYGVVICEQVGWLPWSTLAKPDPVWREASEALGITIEPSIAVARHEPFFALGSPLVCLLALVCGFLVGADRANARAILWWVAVSGLVYAVYGISAHWLDPDHILWNYKAAYVEDLTATFINRNTAAVYFGSCAIISLTLLGERIRQSLPRGHISWNSLSTHLLSDMRRDGAVLVGMLFVFLVAMFMTGSRGGIILSLATLVMAFLINFHRDIPSRGGVVTAAIGAAAIGLILLQFMGGAVNARFASQGFADEGRLATWRGTLRMIAEHPWFGTGQGTFVWSFPAYRSDTISMWGTWDHAHNTLLELAADDGVPLAAIVTLAWILILAVLIYGIRARRRDLAIPLSALAVAILAILHSLIDFSLQIAGFAIPVFAVVGAGVAQSLASERKAHRLRRGQGSGEAI